MCMFLCLRGRDNEARPELDALPVFPGLGKQFSGSESHILYIVFLRLDFSTFYSIIFKVAEERGLMPVVPV